MNGRVAGLFVYPVKGCAGTGLGEARLLARGLEHDRRWMIVTPAGRFLTQREQPALARILPVLGEGELTLRFPDRSELRLPITDEVSRSGSPSGATRSTPSLSRPPPTLP
jgi:uncharacterized protein YcbX